jgi:ribosomal protein L19E
MTKDQLWDMCRGNSWVWDGRASPRMLAELRRNEDREAYRKRYGTARLPSLRVSNQVERAIARSKADPFGAGVGNRCGQITF